MSTWTRIHVSRFFYLVVWVEYVAMMDLNARQFPNLEIFIF